MKIFKRGHYKKADGFPFSSRIARLKWIRKFKKNHPDAIFERSTFPKKYGNIPYYVRAFWDFEEEK